MVKQEWHLKDITHDFVEVGGGHCTESSIGGGEDGVGPFFVQELSQACSLNGANQGAVRMKVHQSTLLDYIFRL